MGALLGKEGRHGESLGASDVKGFREGCELGPLSPVQAVGAPTAVCVLGQQNHISWGQAF